MVALRWYVKKPKKVSYVNKFARADFFLSAFARSLQPIFSVRLRTLRDPSYVRKNRESTRCPKKNRNLSLSVLKFYQR
jgi:hypothetical protein